MPDRHRSPVLAMVGAALLPALVAGPTLAQEEAAGEATWMEVGSRVRVTTDEATGPLVGWVDARGRDGFSLVRASDHAVVPISRDAIRRLEVSRVRRSIGEQSAPGMVAGGLAGLVIGVAITEEHSCQPDSFLCFDFGSEKLMAGMVGASLGMLAGGLLSWAIVPAESWTEFALAPSRVAAGPSGVVVTYALPLPWRRSR